MRFSITHLPENGWRTILLYDSVEKSFAEIIPEAGAILNGFGIRDYPGGSISIAGYQNKNDWENTRQTFYRSAKLTPFVCRIYKGQYTWNDQQLQLHTHAEGGHALHGLVAHHSFFVNEEAVHPEFAEITLQTSYKNTDPGFPFSFDCLIRYRLSPSNILSVHTAVHNRSASPMPLADGWHCYFRSGDSVDKLLLTIHSKERLEYTSDLVPTGKSIPDGRWYNGNLIAGTELDNCYVPELLSGQPVCSLKNPATNQILEVSIGKGYRFIQAYIPPERDAISIEPLSAPPDVLNNRIGLIILAPDHTATFDVQYQLKQIG